MIRVRGLLACLVPLLALTQSVRGDDTVRLKVDTSEADAVLAILARRVSGQTVPDSDWQRLFESAPYRRLKQRETEMKRPFEESEFREFVLSDPLLNRRQELQQTLASWKRINLEASALSVLDYLPSQARIRAKVFPVIKPKTNSFVFDLKGDPTIFLYVDPAVTAEQFANTVRHELHHIGLGSVESEKQLEDLPPPAKGAAGWMGAFGEGMAMLAAAGGPDVHPHAHSSPEDKARWDRDVANFAQDLRTVERFFLDIIDGRMKEDEAREKGFSFFGVQGPWYTVGWKMAVLVEQTYGRATLIECMPDPRRLLATYNSAVKSRKSSRDLPLWSAGLLRAVHAVPAGSRTSRSGARLPRRAHPPRTEGMADAEEEGRRRPGPRLQTWPQGQA
jgi:hypothetical protein